MASIQHTSLHKACAWHVLVLCLMTREIKDKQHIKMHVKAWHVQRWGVIAYLCKIKTTSKQKAWIIAIIKPKMLNNCIDIIKEQAIKKAEEQKQKAVVASSCDHRRGRTHEGWATRAVGSWPTVHPRRTRLGWEHRKIGECGGKPRKTRKERVTT